MTKIDKIKLKPTAKVTITTLVDNYIDTFLPSTEHVKRAPVMKGKVHRRGLLAEHGLSLLVEVEDNSEYHAVVMDFGRDNIAMLNNISVLGIDLEKVGSFVVSHGHMDHIGSTSEVLNRFPKPCEVVVHADAFKKDRVFKFPDGTERPVPCLKRDTIEPSGCSIVEIESPTLLANGYVATLTNITRSTDFEKGMPIAYYRKGGKLYKDEIRDDQGLVINVKDKGLVVLTGCGHSGIINTIQYAQNITGVEKILAVIGGFHLTGPSFEPIIPRTIKEMRRFMPEFLVPIHCTGWRAINEFEKAFPENFVLNSVGTKYIF